MNTNVRLEISDADKKQYKEVFGERPTRKNIKARTVAMFRSALWPDGEPKRKAKKFVVGKGK